MRETIGAATTTKAKVGIERKKISRYDSRYSAGNACGYAARVVEPRFAQRAVDLGLRADGAQKKRRF